MPETIAPNASPKRPSRQDLPAAPRRRGRHVDRMLIGCGVMTALSSLAFAGYMVADTDRAPRIAGLEYLSIFARPSHPLMAGKDLPVAAAAGAPGDEQAQAIDPTPTGSIPDRFGAGGSVISAQTLFRAGEARTTPGLSKILYVSDGEALVQTGLGLRHIRAGDLLPDLGRVNAIEKNGDHWVLSTQNGETLEWPPQSTTGARRNSGR